MLKHDPLLLFAQSRSAERRVLGVSLDKRVLTAPIVPGDDWESTQALCRRPLPRAC